MRCLLFAVAAAASTITPEQASKLRSLGYRASEIAAIRPSVASVVARRGLPRPKAGMPPSWVVDDVSKLPEELRTCCVCLEDVCPGNKVRGHAHALMACGWRGPGQQGAEALPCLHAPSLASPRHLSPSLACAQVRTLPCLHTFHSECAEEWLKKKKVCPLCQFTIDGTTDEGAADRNRLHALLNTPDSPALLRTELKRKIASNDKRIERLRAEAIALIRSDEYLWERFKALDTIQGVGEVSAVSLLSELITLPQTLSSRACVCHAGLDPRVHESGTSVHKAPRISRHGNKYLRRALFYPALAACQSDPGAKAFKARLVGRGKKKMQANVAVMRKMLTVAWAIMKDPEPYDSARLYADLEKA